MTPHILNKQKNHMTSQNVLTVTNIPYNCDSLIHYALLSWSTTIANIPKFDFII